MSLHLRSCVLLIGALFVAVPPSAAQGPWTVPASTNGKVRIPSTADDALCVGGTGVTPSSCTGGAILSKINLGHLTDTTITRASAGVIAVEGVNVLLATNIGSTVQAYDADLGTIAGLSPSNDDILQRKSGSWTNRTMAQLATDLGVVTLSGTQTITGAKTASGGWLFSKPDRPIQFQANNGNYFASIYNQAGTEVWGWYLAGGGADLVFYSNVLGTGLAIEGATGNTSVPGTLQWGSGGSAISSSSVVARTNAANTFTQAQTFGANAILGSNYLSGDGGNEGISVDSSGNAATSGRHTMAGLLNSSTWRASSEVAATDPGTTGTQFPYATTPTSFFVLTFNHGQATTIGTFTTGIGENRMFIAYNLSANNVVLKHNYLGGGNDGTMLSSTGGDITLAQRQAALFIQMPGASGQWAVFPLF